MRRGTLSILATFSFLVVAGYLSAIISAAVPPPAIFFNTAATVSAPTSTPEKYVKTVMTPQTPTIERMISIPTPIPLAPQVMRGDWSSYLMGNNGFNDAETRIDSTTATHLRRYWIYHAQGGISVQPVEVNNILYWGSWDGLEHATNMNGKQIWATYLGQTTDYADGCDPASVGVASTAAVAPLKIGGRTTLAVFVGGGNANFYALNASNGHVLWQTSLGSSPDHFIWSSPVVYKGSIYIGVSSFGDCPSIQGQFVKLNAVDGAIQDVFNVVPTGCSGGSVWGSPTIDKTTGKLYIATGNAAACSAAEPYAVSLVELDASNLNLVDYWEEPQSQWVDDSDFGSTPTLFTATIGGVFHALVGIINKNGIYYTFMRGPISNGPVWTAQISNADGSIAPGAWDGSRLYIAGGNTLIHGKFCQGSLRALDPATGHFLWEHCLEDDRELAAVTAVPGVVVVEEGRYVLAVEAATGKLLFDYEDSHHGSAFWGASSIMHGMLYVGNMDGNLYAFGLYGTPTIHYW